MLPLDIIICGDNVSALAGFPDDSIDLTVTSPPYDNLRQYDGYSWSFDALAPQLYRVTKPGGVVVWVVADATIDGSETGTSFRQALGFMACGFKLHDTMIYASEKPPLTHNRYEQKFEYMFVFAKGKPTTFNPLTERSKLAGSNKVQSFRHDGKNVDRFHQAKLIGETKTRGNIWWYATGMGKGVSDDFAFEHDAIFPDGLAEDHILSWSNPGDVVLDPFVGSGTTPKMAIRHGRRFIGIDISAKYCDLARRRIAAVDVDMFAGLEVA
jgi:DNA modification methylase